MATEKEMFELLGRTLIDANFRAALIANPAETAAGIGITLSEEQQTGLQTSDLAAAPETLDERLSKKLIGRI
jgi:hypothetical protein